jgi:hypothetical protein
MWMKTICFLSLLFVALALAPAMAHLLELLNKINLSREQYLVVQQIYRGWAFTRICCRRGVAFDLGFNHCASPREKGIHPRLDRLSLHCRNSVLDIHLSRQSSDD